MSRLVRVCLALVAVVLVLALAQPAARYAHSAALLTRMSGTAGPWVTRAAGFMATSVTTRSVTIPTRSAPLRGRLYVPGRVRTRPVVLTGGVHAQGIDEPRLASLARQLAAHGTPVVTPELPDLVAYRITPELPNQIEDVLRWITNRRPFDADRTGLVGISFAGGLSVVAAARPAVRDNVAFTVSLGGHGDLRRVLRYLCTGTQPDGSFLRPHDYGVVVVLLNVADRMVPPVQVQPLRHALLTFLRGSHVYTVDRTRGRQIFADAAQQARDLQEPARTFMGYVNTRNVAALGQALLPFVNELGDDPSLSPERSPVPPSPVHLLHGSHDVVIPSAESTRLARSLRARGGRVNVLLSPLITHAELNRRPGIRDTWNLVAFWAGLEW
ncbi:MAG: hypothetical protein GEU99_02080 [Luteitalea sp.]|nr:hypothetical protein [Luteitalea sp.]